MKIQMATFALFITLLFACASGKNAKNDDDIASSQEMIDQGFIKGKIVYSDEEGDCEYTIKTIEEPVEFLDPTNLDDRFKKDGMLVWFKYNGLREANRCEKARPIEIVEIVERK